MLGVKKPKQIEIGCLSTSRSIGKSYSKTIEQRESAKKNYEECLQRFGIIMEPRMHPRKSEETKASLIEQEPSVLHEPLKSETQVPRNCKSAGSKFKAQRLEMAKSPHAFNSNQQSSLMDQRFKVNKFAKPKTSHDQTVTNSVSQTNLFTVNEFNSKVPILMRPVKSTSALQTAQGHCTHKVVPILRINRMRKRAANAN